MHADWIEHVLDTGGEPYLRLPADDLNIFVRHSLDTYGFVLGCTGVLLFLAWQLLLTAASRCRRMFTAKAKPE